MKIDDIVELRDGSYNMSLTKGVMEHIFGIFHQHRRYRVLDANCGGMYPTYGTNSNSKTNDVMLVDVNNPDFVLFTQGRFCHVTTSSPSTPKSAKLEVAVPYETREIRLVLQK